ncbi:MAG: heme/hemin ABC transporter substrate-binding protein [Puniceicoccales bacterium]
MKNHNQIFFAYGGALMALLITPMLQANETAAPAVCPITGKTGPMPKNHPQVDTAKSPDSETTRIISIGGAPTEIVYALGKGDEVVAVDLSSTYPPAATRLPKVGYIRQISPEGVLSLNPDIIVTSEALGPPAAKAALKRVNVPVVWCPDPTSPDALYTSLEIVGQALGEEEKAAELTASIQEKLTDVEMASAQWPQKPRIVFFMQSPTPTRAGKVAGKGTRADELIKLAGGVNAASDVDGYQPFALEALIASHPDVILLGTSLGHGSGPGDAKVLLGMPQLSQIPAVKSGRVETVPMEDLSFGPRLGDVASSWSVLIAPVDSE